jgi:hypothetical protein
MTNEYKTKRKEILEEMTRGVGKDAKQFAIESSKFAWNTTKYLATAPFIGFLSETKKMEIYGESYNDDYRRISGDKSKGATALSAFLELGAIAGYTILVSQVMRPKSRGEVLLDAIPLVVAVGDSMIRLAGAAIDWAPGSIFGYLPSKVIGYLKQKYENAENRINEQGGK